MGRVVFAKNAEPDKWYRLDSLLQDIAAHQPSDPSIVPGGSAIDPQNSVSGIAGVVASSSRPDIFQSATAATESQGGRTAARHNVAFIDPGIAEVEANGTRSGSSIPKVGA